LVQCILTSCELEPATLQFLAQGATTCVWRADTNRGSVVIRLADPAPGKVARFNADVEVRTRLYEVDGRVAEPIALGFANRAAPHNGPTVPWCVDRFIAGQTALRGAIPERVCHDLGQVLSGLHALPVSRHGLLEDRRDVLCGQESHPIAGLLTRLQDPWPFTPFALEDHPLARAAPDLCEQLAPLEDGLKALVTRQRRCCLNHTDLHEGQLLIAGDRLVGLLDFGDATIGPPAWDIASFAYFHGWHLAQMVLTGYTRDVGLRHGILAEARLFAILIALHHASRSVTLRRPHRMQDAIRFLRFTQAIKS
jgi:aminoglycoside phosphotransferase (APT) family kinase protein